MLSKTIISTTTFSKLAYYKKGIGPAIILLHGFPENHGLWHKIVEPLSSRYMVIAPDTPGTGESLLDNKEANIEHLSESLKEIIDKEEIKQCIIAGHSMGGYIALAFAEKYPSLLKGLSLVHSTATTDDEEKKSKRQKTIDLLQKGGKEIFVKEMIPGLFSKKYKEKNKEIIQEQIKRALQLSEESMICFYKAMMNRPDRTSILKQANYPVQMIIGKEETLAPMDVLLEQAAMPSKGFVSVYKNCLHMSMLEQPQRLADDLLNFTEYCYNT